MNVISFEQNICKRMRAYMDSYLNGVPLIETRGDVFKHLESCIDCAAEFEARSRLKSRLQRAVLAEPAPVELREKIQRSR